MSTSQWLENHTQRTLDRLIPRLKTRYAVFAESNPEDWGIFVKRLN